jgi:hypothetical protein
MSILLIPPGQISRFSMTSTYDFLLERSRPLLDRLAQERAQLSAFLKGGMRSRPLRELTR